MTTCYDAYIHIVAIYICTKQCVIFTTPSFCDYGEHEENEEKRISSLFVFSNRALPDTLKMLNYNFNYEFLKGCSLHTI